MLSLKNIDFSNNKSFVNYKDSIFLVGSCFAENIYNQLYKDYFDVYHNPFGITFNPISIVNILNRICDKNYFVKDNFFFFDNYYWCFEHHGSLANIDLDEYLNLSNQKIDFAYQKIKSSKVLFLTLGTSLIYSYQNQVVSNCHKQPQSLFESSQLSTNEIIEAFSNLFLKIKNINSSIHIVFTISPVRYIKHGFLANSISKSVLHLSVQQLVSNFNFVQYFPAYEYVIDILRDYTFYNDDGIHPNQATVNKIYSLFLDHFLDFQSTEYIKELNDLKKLMDHKILHPYSNSSIQLQNKISFHKQQFILKYGINL